MKVTRRQARVLKYLLERRPWSQSAGFVDIHRATRVGPGTFYPLMVQLELAGFVVFFTEQLPPGAKVPPRTFYALTEQGANWARDAVEEREARQPFWRRWFGARKNQKRPSYHPSPPRDPGLIEDTRADRAYWDDKYAE